MIKEIISAISSGKRFLITAHVRLDGDALGSELALAWMLKDLGKEAVIYNQDATPGHYRFLRVPKTSCRNWNISTDMMSASFWTAPNWSGSEKSPPT
jgi:phosphoesterase RecJ-like protein